MQRPRGRAELGPFTEDVGVEGREFREKYPWRPTPRAASPVKGSHLEGSRGSSDLQRYGLLGCSVRSPRPWQRAPGPLGLLQRPGTRASGDPSWRCRLTRSCAPLHNSVKWGRGHPPFLPPRHRSMVGPRPPEVAEPGFSLRSVGGKSHTPNLHPQFCCEHLHRQGVGGWGPQALAPGTAQAARDPFPPGHQTTPGSTSGSHVASGAGHPAAWLARGEP